MISHFLFNPGEWLGEGEIQFSMSDDTIRFFTKWIIRYDGDELKCTQEVQLAESRDKIINSFEIKSITEETFEIQLSNEYAGTYKGTGIIEDKKIAWEFRHVGAFEGYEVYQLIGDEMYSFHAEYLSTDSVRTKIKGKIWKKHAELF